MGFAWFDAVAVVLLAVSWCLGSSASCWWGGVGSGFGFLGFVVLWFVCAVGCACAGMLFWCLFACLWCFVLLVALLVMKCG